MGRRGGFGSRRGGFGRRGYGGSRGYRSRGPGLFQRAMMQRPQSNMSRAVFMWDGMN